MRCVNCGNMVPDGQAFCNYCGTPLPQSSEHTIWQPPAQQPPAQQYPAQQYPAQQYPAQGYNNGNNYYQAGPSPVEPPPSSRGSNNNTNTVLIGVVAALAAMIIGFGVWWALSNHDKPSSLADNKQSTTEVPTDVLSQLQQVVSQRELTSTEVASLDKDQRRLLRNYIFARHGYIFKDSQLQHYFDQFDWYHGVHTSADRVSATFNNVEKANVEHLVDNTSSSGTLSPGYYSFVGHCNLREFPRSDSYVVGTAENNYTCYVSEMREGSWYWVTVTETGASGWTHRQNLRK